MAYKPAATTKRQYNPTTAFTVPLVLLIPTYTTVQGIRKKTYPATANGIRINASFKTYGGTETTINDIYSIIDTASVVTFYRPDIKSDCAIEVLQTNARYEIIGEPENVDMKNQFLRFTVQRIKGGT